jgi:hypothetical protein
MSEEKKSNRVWIEIEWPQECASKEERDALGKERAEALSRLIERLGGEKDFCFWHPNLRSGQGIYCFGGKMGFVEASDHGHWFNLDFLGRAE